MLPPVPKKKKLGFKIKQINFRWGLTCETSDSLRGNCSPHALPLSFLAEDSHSPLLSPRDLSSLPRPAQRRHASSQKPPLPLVLSAPPAMPPLEPLLSLFYLPWKRCSWTPADLWGGQIVRKKPSVGSAAASAPRAPPPRQGGRCSAPRAPSHGGPATLSARVRDGRAAARRVGAAAVTGGWGRRRLRSWEGRGTVPQSELAGTTALQSAAAVLPHPRRTEK